MSTDEYSEEEDEDEIGEEEEDDDDMVEDDEYDDDDVVVDNSSMYHQQQQQAHGSEQQRLSNNIDFSPVQSGIVDGPSGSSRIPSIQHQGPSSRIPTAFPAPPPPPPPPPPPFSVSSSSSNDQRQKRKYTRRKMPEERKRRGPRTKDLNAPRMPLNGYVRFLNANRERVKVENPDLSFADVTKKLAAEWSSMNSEEKKIYLDEAEKAKEAYLKELHEYQRSDLYQEFMASKQRVKMEQQQQAYHQQQRQQQQYNQSRGTYPDYNIPHHQYQLPPSQPQHYQQYTAIKNNSNSFYAAQQNRRGGAGNHGLSLNYPTGTYHQYGSQHHNKNSSQNYSHHHFESSQQSHNSSGQISQQFSDGDGHKQNWQPLSKHENNSFSSSSSSSLSNIVVGSGSVNPNNHHGGNDSGSLSSNSSNSLRQSGTGIPTDSLVSILGEKAGSSSSGAIVDLPIFTEEFLEHNKLREQELRNLRSFTMDYEQTNAISSKHIDEMVKASDRLQEEFDRKCETLSRLTSIEERLQGALVEHFDHHISGLPKDFIAWFSSSNSGGSNNNNGTVSVTRENLDRFMETLNRSVRQTTNDGLSSLQDQIRNVIHNLDQVLI